MVPVWRWVAPGSRWSKISSKQTVRCCCRKRCVRTWVWTQFRRWRKKTKRKYLEVAVGRDELRNRPDQNHRPGRSRFSAGRLERHRESLGRSAGRHLSDDRIRFAVRGIENSRADRRAGRRHQPKLVA